MAFVLINVEHCWKKSRKSCILMTVELGGLEPHLSIHLLSKPDDGFLIQPKHVVAFEIYYNKVLFIDRAFIVTYIIDTTGMTHIKNFENLHLFHVSTVYHYY
jgi:hypothetical protein